MKADRYFSMLTALSIMGDGLGMMPFKKKKRRKDKDIDLRSKEPPIPNGCKKYYFREDGTFMNNDVLGQIDVKEIVYTCIASKDKSAIKKFKTYQNDNQSNNSK